MIRLSLTKLAAAAGGVAFAFTAATGVAGVASADPMDAVINTTCNYNQVMAALNATDPASAAKFNRSAAAQSFLNNFLAAGPPQRAQMATQIPPSYMGVIQRVAGVCNNY
jgi:hemophore-related protein